MGLGQGSRGYAMAALLVGMSVMAVLMSAAMPVWSQLAKREREAELIWRGEQYARAVGLFQRKYANTFPPSVDILVEQRFLRKKYKDPMTGEDFQAIPAGGGMPPGSVAPPSGGGSQRSVAPPIQQLPPTQAFQGRPNGVGQVGSGGTMPGQPPRPGQSGPTQPMIGIQGVVSKSTDSALKIYNGRTKYNEWAFIHMATARQIMPPGNQQRPGTGPGNPPGGVPPGTFQGGGTTLTPIGGADRRPPVPGGPPPPRPPRN